MNRGTHGSQRPRHRHYQAQVRRPKACVEFSYPTYCMSYDRSRRRNEHRNPAIKIAVSIGAHLHVTRESNFHRFSSSSASHVLRRSALEHRLNAPYSPGHFGIILSIGLKGCQRDPLSFVKACRKDTFEGVDLPCTC